MKLPAGMRWMPAQWRWAALSEGDRLLLVLSLSLLLHLPLFMRLTHEGSLRGQPQAMSVRLGQAARQAVPPPQASKPASVARLVIQPPPAPRHRAQLLLAAAAKTRLAHAASAAVASPATPPSATPSQLATPQPPLSDASPMLAASPASASLDDAAEAQQLGLDFYYAARQLDVLALEQLPIQLVEPYGLGMDDVEVSLRVYINEQGGVDAVQLVSARPAGVEGPLLEVFRQAKFYPAIRDGHPVKSFKVIRIGPQSDGAMPGD
ncbi:hypothetical protein DBR44_12205 [Aquitalea sp. FJL05]|uniref:hypothetical protein n=1 Tax=Aquitalea TaxID=407217 RepID=UPI000F59EC29|nr:MULTISPECIES: hypothetical protein [Aquitalea]RQO71200.1 hypothetical protein DBR44_12205 [Aquitalea sp. FJL05]